MQPFYRAAREFVFETDHPKFFLNPGYPMNPKRAKFLYICPLLSHREHTKKRKYSAWIPCEDSVPAKIEGADYKSANATLRNELT